MSDLTVRFDRIRIAKDLASDAVEHLVEDLSQYDSLYGKYSLKKIGQFAMLNARDAAAFRVVEDNVFACFEDEPKLFPEIERLEKIEAMTEFARQVGSVNVGSLFTGTLHKNRPYGKEIFPYPDGKPRVASVYTEAIWAPMYAEEFVDAHEIELITQNNMEKV